MKFRLILLTSAFVLAACENPCLTLAKKVCACEGVSSEVEDCEDRVEAEESRIDITEAQEEFCKTKLDTCSCSGLDTPQGQANCGLSNEE